MFSIITAHTKVLKPPPTSKDETPNARAYRTLLAAAGQTGVLSLGVVHCLFPQQTQIQKKVSLQEESVHKQQCCPALDTTVERELRVQ